MARPTNDQYVDSVLYGDYAWGLSTLTYYFDNSYDTWTFDAKRAFKSALETWSDVADIDFQEVFFSGSANLIEYFLDDAAMTAEVGGGVLGAHEVPLWLEYDSWLQGWFNYESFGWPGPNGYDADALDPGGIGFTTLVHELGHALGLAHPHDSDSLTVQMPGVSSASDLGTNKLNQGVFTVMSYNDGWIGQDPWGSGVNDMGYNSGPAAFDIAAIQYLYGANMSNNGGNNVYKINDHMGWSAIWDTGGTDKLAYLGNEDVVLNLRSAPLDESANAGGYLSYVVGSNNYGGYTIAGDQTDALSDVRSETGVIIENATAGGGDDKVYGNAANNILRGNGGKDYISAGNGRDKVLAGNGNDKAKGGGGNDKLYGEGGNDELDGSNGRDQLFGGGGNDVLKGAVGDDTLNGGKGRDILRGGSGDDRFVFRDDYGFDKVMDFKDRDDMLTFDDALWDWRPGVTINTAQDLIDEFASVNAGGHVVFNFRNGGDKLMLVGIDSTADLADNINII